MLSYRLPLRLLLGSVLLVAVFVAPWWAVALVVLIGAIRFDHYYEALPAGIALDSLYAAPVVRLAGLTFVFFAGFALLVFVIEIAKKRMRVFDRV